MYTTRDPEIIIPVHPGACYVYESKARGEMIEILTPPENAAGYDALNTWGSIMVEKEQVRTVSPELNVVYVNDGARIISSVKNEDHVAVSSEEILPSEITARWLKWFRARRFAGLTAEQADIPSSLLWDDFRGSRMDVISYVNRLPYLF